MPNARWFPWILSRATVSHQALICMGHKEWEVPWRQTILELCLDYQVNPPTGLSTLSDVHGEFGEMINNLQSQTVWISTVIYATGAGESLCPLFTSAGWDRAKDQCVQARHKTRVVNLNFSEALRNKTRIPWLADKQKKNSFFLSLRWKFSLSFQT